MSRRVRLLLLAPLWLLGLVVLGLLGQKALRGDADQPPESATGRREVALARSKRFMVAAAHPLAAEAGQEMLEAGGSALDAAVAVQAMLTLVEPQSSGIGGGAFLLHFSAADGKLDAFDGRETAPAAVTPSLFVHEDGDPYAFVEALVGGRSVGAPGVLRMLEEAHRWHGRLPWARLFSPAIRTAREGFEVTPRLHLLLRRDPLFRTMPAARALYYDDNGRAKPVGVVHQNPALAGVLEAVAVGGADAFYEGEIAEAIVHAVRSAVQPADWLVAANSGLLELGFATGIGMLASDPAPGFLALEDLEGYEAKLREPVCLELSAHRVCGHPPPTSGGVTTLQILGILSHFDLSRLAPDSVEAAHLLAEAGKLAFADRAAYLGDPAFVPVPVERLLEPDYLAARARLIRPDRVLEKVAPGKVKGGKQTFRPDTSPSLPSTSHFSVVDSEGNVVSMTTSVENVFGSRIVVEGFVLNNQLTDFAFVPTRDGAVVANAVAPGKRPRSSMSPLIVFDRSTGRPVLAVGSPGGSRIIGYVVRALTGMLEWGLDPQAAVSLPHVLGRGGPVELENEGWGPGVLDQLRDGLERLGHEVRVGPHSSGLHAILIKPDGSLEGGVDPRREGVALGEPDPAGGVSPRR